MTEQVSDLITAQHDIFRWQACAFGNDLRNCICAFGYFLVNLAAQHCHTAYLSSGLHVVTEVA